MTETSFADHFSSQAESYQLYRPGYPDELFAYLASLLPQHNRAWDCATGSGQAAVKLTDYFAEVVATDASRAQINNAVRHEKVQFLVCQAEQTPFAGQSLDLITVAQALHWFELEKFYQEVRRVLKPDGVIAAWTYNLLEVTPEIDVVIHDLYHKYLGEYWPFERSHIENGYQDLAFPFTRCAAPGFAMTTEWSLDHLLGYLSTWSAVQLFKHDFDYDPVERIAHALASAWGEQTSQRTVSWPLAVHIGRNQSG